MNLSLEVVLDL